MNEEINRLKKELTGKQEDLKRLGQKCIELGKSVLDLFKKVEDQNQRLSKEMAENGRLTEENKELCATIARLCQTAEKPFDFYQQENSVTAELQAEERAKSSSSTASPMTPVGTLDEVAIEHATERLLDYMENEGKDKFSGEFPRDNYREGFRRYVRVAVENYIAKAALAEVGK